jgi:hypothetical protein
MRHSRWLMLGDKRIAQRLCFCMYNLHPSRHMYTAFWLYGLSDTAYVRIHEAIWHRLCSLPRWYHADMTPWPHHVTINIISAVPLSTLARSAVPNMTPAWHKLFRSAIGSGGSPPIRLGGSNSTTPTGNPTQVHDYWCIADFKSRRAHHHQQNYGKLHRTSHVIFVTVFSFESILMS